MKKHLALGIAITFAGSFLVTPAFGAAKAGVTCAKAGVTSIVSGKKFTCVKSGKKLVWDKGTTTSNPSSASQQNPIQSSNQETTINAPTPTEFKTFCDWDYQVPQEWAAVQQWSAHYLRCARPYRYVPASTPVDVMKTEIGNISSLPISQCKLDDPVGRQWNWQSFANSNNAFRPTKSAVVQVIPIQFTDATSTANPQVEYGKYFEFYKNFMINSSDVAIKPEYRVPDHYFQVGFSVSKYTLNDEHASHAEFLAEVSDKIGSEFKLSDVDQILFVVPSNIPANQVIQGMNFGNPEATKFKGKSIYLQGSSDLGARYGDSWTPDPWITIHESIGHQMGLDDHVGAELYENNAVLPSNLKDLGSGQWGNMSGVTGDFLIWDKWTVGWVADAQISCIANTSKVTIALTPSTTKSTKTKALVIPLSQSKGIVVESERSTGYNFKMPKATNGALVYVVDMKEVAHGGGMPWGYGVYVQRPVDRPALIFQNGMTLGDATLKQGESISVEGVKISVVEAGDFGDVIQIG
jgi:M6 family metalloprotease-like protein